MYIPGQPNVFGGTPFANAASRVIAGGVSGSIFGLTLSTAGASAIFGIAAGVATNSTNVSAMTLASAYTKTTSAWAVGTGNGSLDTGAIANSTWYHAFQIQRPDTGVVDVLVSLSATAPTLPTNYTLFRRIGSMKTNGSAQWNGFVQLGNEFLWTTPVNDVNVATLGTTATLFTLSVPALQVMARFRGFFTNAATSTIILVNSPDEATAAPNAVSGNLTADNPTAGNGQGTIFTLDVRTNSSGQIRAVSSAASTTLVVATYGWIDTRGQYG